MTAIVMIIFAIVIFICAVSPVTIDFLILKLLIKLGKSAELKKELKNKILELEPVALVKKDGLKKKPQKWYGCHDGYLAACRITKNRGRISS